MATDSLPPAKPISPKIDDFEGALPEVRNRSRGGRDLRLFGTIGFGGGKESVAILWRPIPYLRQSPFCQKSMISSGLCRR